MGRSTNELGHLARQMSTSGVGCAAMRGKRLAAPNDACYRLAQHDHAPARELLVVLNNHALSFP